MDSLRLRRRELLGGKKVYVWDKYNANESYSYSNPTQNHNQTAIAYSVSYADLANYRGKQFNSLYNMEFSTANGWRNTYTNEMTSLQAVEAEIMISYGEGQTLQIIEHTEAQSYYGTYGVDRLALYSCTKNTTYSKGNTHYGTVEDTDENAYPANGYQGGYWYVLRA